MKIKARMKRYFTEKPKQNFWFYAFITLLFFRYVTPMMLVMMIPFQIGLIAPDTEVNYQNISMNIAEGLVKPLETLNDVGKTIGTERPIVAKVIFYGLAYLVYAIWFAAIVLVINLFRYGISWSIRKVKEKKK